MQPIIDRFHYRPSPWKVKTLSIGGRLTLAKVILGSITSYFFSLFVAPTSVIQALEKIRRQFIRGGIANEHKISRVAWEKIVAPKDIIGLGLGSLIAINLSLVVRWW